MVGGVRTLWTRSAGTRTRSFGFWLAVIAVFALGIRLAYVVELQGNHLPLRGDSFAYSGGANLLAHGQGWIEALSVFKHVQTADHPPLYMLYLAAFARVAPWYWTDQLTFLCWTCFLGAGSVVLCGLAGREVAGARLGLVAAGLAAIDPNMWVNDGQLLSESMAIFTVAGVILFAYRFRRRPSVWRALWLGMWIGLAALSRSELLLAAVFVLVPIVLLVREVDLWRRLRWLLVGGLGTAVVIAPWVGFNLARFDEPVYLSTNFGRTMVAANCHETYYGSHLGFKSYTCLTRTSRRFLTPDMDESQVDKVMRREAKNYMKAHLTRLPVVVLARWGRILEVYKPGQEQRLNGYGKLEGHWVARFVLWGFYVMVVLSIVGAVVLRRWRVPVYPLLAFPAIVLVAVALTFAEQRYRAAAQPALVILSAVAIEAFLRSREARRFADETASFTSDMTVAAPRTGV